MHSTPVPVVGSSRDHGQVWDAVEYVFDFDYALVSYKFHSFQHPSNRNDNRKAVPQVLALETYLSEFFQSENIVFILPDFQARNEDEYMTSQLPKQESMLEVRDIFC